MLFRSFVTFIFIYLLALNVYADPVKNPCGGDSALINIIDRPTAADSACVVPFKNVVLETGYQYQWLTHSAGHEQNFPAAEFRLGLPADNEFVVVLGNYIRQSMTPHSGFTATTLGLKHEIGYNEHWLGAVETMITLPDGSAAFGNKGTGAAFNGIISYTFNPTFNITLMLGGTTGTQPSHDGGRRFGSVNPDIVLTYSATDKIDLYAEVYGQSKTAPGEGSGFNSDVGVIYLALPKLAVDAEVGQRISGNLTGFNQYVGAGISFMF